MTNKVDSNWKRLCALLVSRSVTQDYTNNTPFRSPKSAIEQLVSSDEDKTENERQNVEEISCDDWTSSDEDFRFDLKYIRYKMF